MKLTPPDRLRFRPLVPAFLALLTPHVLHAEWRMEILPQEWHLAGFENSHDLSGIVSATPTLCLVGSDESYYVQPGMVDLEKRRIESRRPIALPVQENGEKAEIDIEGVAYSELEKAYFVVGSHGLGKKKADFQADRHSIYQIGIGPETGMVRKDSVRRASLLPWLEKTPLLAEHVRKPLQQNGLNIGGSRCRETSFFSACAPLTKMASRWWWSSVRGTFSTSVRSRSSYTRSAWKKAGASARSWP